FCFQAEAGIRGFHVTGVQTCALPISQGVGRHYSVHSVPADTACNHGDAIMDVIRIGAGVVLVLTFVGALLVRNDPLPSPEAVLRSERRRVRAERGPGRASPP